MWTRVQQRPQTSDTYSFTYYSHSLSQYPNKLYYSFQLEEEQIILTVEFLSSPRWRRIKVSWTVWNIPAQSSALKYIIDSCRFLVFKVYLMVSCDLSRKSFAKCDNIRLVWESCKSTDAEKWGSILICPIRSDHYWHF